MAKSTRETLTNGVVNGVAKMSGIALSLLNRKSYAQAVAEASSEEGKSVDLTKTTIKAEEAKKIETPTLSDEEKSEIKRLANTPRVFDWKAKAKPLVVSKTTDSAENVDKKEAKLSRKVRMAVLGCAGNVADPAAQKLVAEQIAALPEKPDVIIIVGDNFYDHGVDSCTDSSFTTNFDKVYTICGVPCIVLAGNHDYNICRSGKTNGNFDPEKIHPQILRTYMTKEGKLDPGLVKKYQAKEADISTWQAWNMTSRFNLHRPNDGVELYNLDSNTYVRDFLRSLKEEKDNPNNQALWLQAMMKINPDAVKLGFLHHPPVTIGKRALDPDAWQYLSPEELAALKELGIEGSYNDMLRQIFRRQGIHFEAMFAAHDHFMHYHVEADAKDECTNKIAVVGGGGGDLQKPVIFDDPEGNPYYESNYGFAEVVVDPDAKDKLTIAFNNVNKQRYVFVGNNRTASVEGELDEMTAMLREVMLASCNAHLKTLRSSVTNTDIIQFIPKYIKAPPVAYVTSSLRNFFNQFTSPSLLEGIAEIEKTAPKELMAFIDANFSKTSFGTFKAFAAKMRETRTPPKDISQSKPRVGVAEDDVHEHKDVASDEIMMSGGDSGVFSPKFFGGAPRTPAKKDGGHVRKRSTGGSGGYSPGHFQTKDPKAYTQAVGIAIVENYFQLEDQAVEPKPVVKSLTMTNVSAFIHHRKNIFSI
jgi:hypothetical protein